MNRARCECGKPWSNEAVHLEVPYLAEPGDLTVYYCRELGRHQRVPLSWSTDVRRALSRAGAHLRRRSLGRGLRRDRRAVGVGGAVFAWAFAAFVFVAQYWFAVHFGRLAALLSPVSLLLDFLVVVVAVGASFLSIAQRPGRGPASREWGKE